VVVDSPADFVGGIAPLRPRVRPRTAPAVKRADADAPRAARASLRVVDLLRTDIEPPPTMGRVLLARGTLQA
jgi:hypothetical protein